MTWQPSWIWPKFYLTCIKAPSHVLTVPNMNEICSFMSENGPRNRFHMLSIWKTYFATGQPSWIKISKRGYVHQWATIDNVYAWRYPGHIIKYWDLTAERSILKNPKSALRRPSWIRPKFYLTCIKVLSYVITVHNMNDQFIHVRERAAEWFLYVK